MKRVILFSLMIIGFFPFSGAASHIHGAEIFYEYIGDSTNTPNHYVAHVNLYRRYVGGASLPSNLSMSVNVSCGSNFILTLNRFIPAGATAAGDGGHFPKMEECVDITGQSNLYKITVHSYKKDFVLAGNCLHTLSVNITGRTFPDNLNPYSGNIDLSTIIDNQLGDNTSPRFEQYPQVYHCINQNVVSNYGAIEVEGDSVYYELVTPRSNGTPYGYQPGYSARQPISTNSGVFLDSLIGIMVFSPDVQQRVAVKVQANEYRYDSTVAVWQKIGETSRDITLTVNTSCSNTALDFSLTKDSLGFDSLAAVYCKDSIIQIRTEQPYIITSLAADGSDFSILGDSAKLYPVSHVKVFDTINTLYAQGIEIHLKKAIENSDTLIIYPQIGSDTNSLFNHCGYEISIGDSVMASAIDTCVETNPSFIMGENRLEGQIELYPNPAQNFVEVKLPTILIGEIERIELITLDGRGVIMQDVIDTSAVNILNLSDLKHGVYLVFLHFSDGGYATKKLVKF